MPSRSLSSDAHSRTTCGTKKYLSIFSSSTPCGDTPCGDRPCGDTPCGNPPCGDTPCGHKPCGHTPCGYTPCGDTPCGDTLSGDALLVSRIRGSPTSPSKVWLMDVSILIQPTFNQHNLRPRYPRHGQSIQRSSDPAIQKRTLHCAHKLIDDLEQLKDPSNGATGVGTRQRAVGNTRVATPRV